MMTLTKRTIPGLIALVCGAFCAPMAQAAYTTGDLLLAFRSTNATANTFVVDIGQASLYRDSTGTIDVTGNLGATLNAGLTSAFGAGWASDTGLTMGILATGFPLPGDGSGRAVYVGASGTTYAPLATGDLNGLYSNITSFANSGADGSFSTFVANGANASNVSLGGNGAVISTSLSNDYTDYAALSAYFGYLPAGGNELNVVNGFTGSTLDLYRILASTSGATDAPTAARTPQLQGSFSISNTGAVSFNAEPAAVPEPSRVILLGLGLGGLFVRRRRASK